MVLVGSTFVMAGCYDQQAAAIEKARNRVSTISYKKTLGVSRQYSYIIRVILLLPTATLKC